MISPPPPWLPDPRKPEEYPDPETTSLRQWAWEFLRRNPQYQEDYERFKDVLSVPAEVCLKYSLISRRLRDPAMDTFGPSGPPRFIDEGVLIVRPPDKNRLSPAWFDPNELPPHFLVVAIDLSVSTKRQAELVRQLADNELGALLSQGFRPRRRKKPRPESLRLHLRLLDLLAVGCGVGPAMADVIYPGEPARLAEGDTFKHRRRLESAIATALEYRDHGYCSLPLAG